MTSREITTRLRREGWTERAGKGAHIVASGFSRNGRRAMRVDISPDEGLLARIDDAARRTRVSRSSLLAKGARLVIATELAS